MKEEERKPKLEDFTRVKHRDLMYKLIISQLFYDGHQQLATDLAELVGQENAPIVPSDRLMALTGLGLQHESEIERPMNKLEYTLGQGLDLEYETEPQSSAAEPALYETAYVTSHKDRCRAGAFSLDGNLVATGSVDASIKVLDVDRMLAKSDPDAVEIQPDAVVGHPVIRTLYDHLDEITVLEFHPREQVLISGSRDSNVKLFDYSKAIAKKAFKTISDAEPVTTLSLHPSGDYISVGTDGPIVRIYDINTSQCYVCPNAKEHHTASVTSVKYSADGKMLVSSSKDGSIKIWDGISGRCTQTFVKSHDGAVVCSVLFSRNGKYILSSGMDSVVKLWEITTGRCLIAYTGAGTLGRQEHSAHSMFNHTEDFVMFSDEATTSLCSWDSRNAQRKNLLSLGHNGPVRHMAHSPCTPAFISCSDDFRARFWFRRNVH